MFKKIFTLTLGFLFVGLIFVNIKPAFAETTNIYFFWGKTCPHCQDEKAHLEFLEGKYPELKVHSNELSSSDSQKLLQAMAQAYKARTGTVPVTFIGEDAVYGAQLDEITSKVENCIQNGCLDPLEKTKQKLGEASISNLAESNPQEALDSKNQTLTIIIIIAAVIIIVIFVIVIFKR